MDDDDDDDDDDNDDFVISLHSRLRKRLLTPTIDRVFRSHNNTTPCCLPDSSSSFFVDARYSRKPNV